MGEKLKKFIQNHNFSTMLLILDFIIFILLFLTQGIIWIILSIIFWILIVTTLGSFLVLKSRYLIDKKLRDGEITLLQSKSDKKFVAIMIVIILIVLGSLGYLIYAMFIPNFKGAINEEYLQETVYEITKNKNTDYDKVSAVLEWFDPDKENIFNWWTLTHSDKPYFNLPGSYIYFVTEEPYICIRCYEDNDPRWLLTSRCGACGEYSRLFMVMIDALNIDVRRVHAPGEDHLWNEVKINDIWIPVDPTNVSLPEGDGWEDYGFFEWKEGNASYIWAEYLNNNTIDDLTYLYTDLTNITIHCVDNNNNSVSDMKISIKSNNLHNDDRIHETYVEGKSKPRTNNSGSVTFQIGGGTYKFKAENDKYKGETKWLAFSDQVDSHKFIINVTKI